MLLTDLMNRILDVDDDAMTVTIQGGATLMMVDLYLSETGLGLSILGDHDHITAAGFASVGGISPASHRHGMFVDTVQAIEYVDQTGAVHRCSRTERTDDLLRVLGGTGKHGIITELTVNIVRVDKFRTMLHNKRHITASLDDFVRYSAEMIREPGDAVMERGVWADFELPVLPGVSVQLGQFSSYHPTAQRFYKSWWNDLAYGFQHQLGYWAGRLPTVIDDLAKYVGMGAIMFSPRYAAMKNIERFTDQILDATVGDPTRMFVVLAPVERYQTLFHQLLETCVAERRRTGAISFISVYVKSIKSPYLAGGDPDRRYCEIMLYLGVRPEKMTDRVLHNLVGTVDRLVVANGAFRYMHSLTSTDPAIREKVDPNAQYQRSTAGTRRPSHTKPDVTERQTRQPARTSTKAGTPSRTAPRRTSPGRNSPAGTAPAPSTPARGAPTRGTPPAATAKPPAEQAGNSGTATGGGTGRPSRSGTSGPGGNGSGAPSKQSAGAAGGHHREPVRSENGSGR